MERWHGKVAIITGASSGIGAAVAQTFARHGLQVVGLARRLDKLQQLSADMKGAKGKIHAVRCDVTNEEDILRAFEWTERELGSIDVLVNNAGVLVFETIMDGSTENYRKILDTNVIGTAICAREAIRRMKKQSTQGHIFNLNSYAGHFAESVTYPISLYAASKYAVTAMGMSLRHELTAKKVNVKITSISPGAVKTDMIKTTQIDPETMAKIPMLKESDVADAITYALSVPAHVEVNELLIVPHGYALPPLPTKP